MKKFPNKHNADQKQVSLYPPKNAKTVASMLATFENTQGLELSINKLKTKLSTPKKLWDKPKQELKFKTFHMSDGKMTANVINQLNRLTVGSTLGSLPATCLYELSYAYQGIISSPMPKAKRNDATALYNQNFSTLYSLLESAMLTELSGTKYQFVPGTTTKTNIVVEYLDQYGALKTKEVDPALMPFDKPLAAMMYEYQYHVMKILQATVMSYVLYGSYELIMEKLPVQYHDKAIAIFNKMAGSAYRAELSTAVDSIRALYVDSTEFNTYLLPLLIPAQESNAIDTPLEQVHPDFLGGTFPQYGVSNGTTVTAQAAFGTLRTAASDFWGLDIFTITSKIKGSDTAETIAESILAIFKSINTYIAAHRLAFTDLTTVLLTLSQRVELNWKLGVNVSQLPVFDKFDNFVLARQIIMAKIATQLSAPTGTSEGIVFPVTLEKYSGPIHSIVDNFVYEIGTANAQHDIDYKVFGPRFPTAVTKEDGTEQITLAKASTNSIAGTDNIGWIVKDKGLSVDFTDTSDKMIYNASKAFMLENFMYAETVNTTVTATPVKTQYTSERVLTVTTVQIENDYALRHHMGLANFVIPMIARDKSKGYKVGSPE